MESWWKQMKGAWKALAFSVVAIGVLGTAAGMGKSSVRWAAGMDVVEERLDDISADVKNVKKDQRRHELTVQIRDLRAGIWAIEDRWIEKFFAQKGRNPDNQDELTAFMETKARREFKELQEEFDDLKAKLKKMDDEAETKDEADKPKEKDDE